MPGEAEEKDTTRTAYARIYVLKKTERLSAVNALIEPQLTGRDEFRDILLKKTYMLYESALALYSQRFGPLKDAAERVKDVLRALEGLYEVGRHGRVLDDSTARLLIRECRTLRGFVDREFLGEGSGGSGTGTGGVVDARMFAVEDAVRAEWEKERKEYSPYLPHSVVPHEPRKHQGKETSVKDDLYTDVNSMSDMPGAPQPASSGASPLPVSSGAAVRKGAFAARAAARKTGKTGSAAMRHKDRRARILALLQTRERVSIKDVVREITDCSEKTIQRELAALVAQGVLKKEGERRWSTYTLA